MSNLSHSESRRMYSWWWDSHNTPKNSKWLQDNLTDIDCKIKSMIKLIEEDADSFARRAEMYYKKRPELMKLVEEFYRAYRALAERYNHATGELRHAQLTIAKSFPDQVPFEPVGDNAPSQEWAAPPSPLTKLPGHPLFNNAYDLLGNSTCGLSSSEGGPRKKGLEQLPEMFGAKKSEARNENLDDEIERAKEAESEVQCLKKALADVKAEKENVLIQYKQCLEKLSEIECELNNAQKDSTRLGEKADRAEIEVQTLKEALIQIEVEKIAEMIKQNDYLEKIARLEALVSRFQEDMKGLDGKPYGARNLKVEISRLELEKETVARRYKLCLGKISDLEKIISSNENEVKSLKKRSETAENEVSRLTSAFAGFSKEKEDLALEYKCCLEKLSEVERNLFISKNDAERLNHEVLTLAEMSNCSLRDEADNLAKKITIKDQELVKKQEELEKIQTCLQEDRSRHARVEATLESLRDLHCQSQDDQKALALELNNVVRMVKDMEMRQNGSEDEIEPTNLSRTNLSSSVSMENMQNENIGLMEIRDRLENEVSYHMGVTISLQKETLCLKEEIEVLNRSYKALVEQVEAAGLNPENVETSLKSLHDENSKLRRKSDNDNIEKAIMSRKLEGIKELLKKKVIAESSVSDLNTQLAASREEKANLVAEKASVLSQLQAVTESMNNLFGKNAVLEDALTTAKAELQGLREKSKGLEEICELIKNERSYLLNERGILVLKLENVEKRLNSLEKQFTGLEIKYAGVEKEKEAMHCQVGKLKFSLCKEKQDRKGYQLESETRLAGLENQIHLLQEENQWRKKESEEELDKSLKAQFEISILQKFIKDMEDNNRSLILECQKHVGASKLAEKLISQLERESLEQQVEAELLLDEIERLRLGIYQIFGALESDTDFAHDDKKVENEQIFVDHILGSIEDLKCRVNEHEDEKQQLLVENSVLLALLEQLESRSTEIESKKVHLERESEIMAEKLLVVENEKDELVEINRQLKSDVAEGCREAAVLQDALESLSVKQAGMEIAYTTLQEAYGRVNEEKFDVNRKNDVILCELLATENRSTVLRGFGREKVGELKLLLEEMRRQHDVSTGLEKETDVLREKLELRKAENLVLEDAVSRLEREMHVIMECNAKMNEEIINGKESLDHREKKLEAAEKLNSDLLGTVDKLKSDIHSSLWIRENLEKNMLELSEDNSAREKEIVSLHTVNKNLECEVVSLHREMEENTMREQSLSAELEEIINESKLWEAEALAFRFDLQVSSTNEVLLRTKVQELSGVCETLEHKHEAGVSEIERMKEKICSMENEVSGFKSQLRAYDAVIASLRDDIATIEQNALLHIKLKAPHCQETELFEATELPEDQPLHSLQNLRMRVKAVGKLIEEANDPVQSNLNSIHELLTVEIDRLKPRHSRSRIKRYRNELTNSPKSRKLKANSSKVRVGTLMKDIPLDQVSSNSSERVTKMKSKDGSDDLMLELWETAEVENKDEDHIFDESLKMLYKSPGRDRYENVKGKYLLPLTDSDVEKELAVDKSEIEPIIDCEMNDAEILEKLASDAEKLEVIEATLRNLRRKLETNKKSRNGKNINYRTAQEQLQEAEDSVVHLVDLNAQLVKNIEDCPKDEEMEGTLRTWKIKVTEQAGKGSERIEQLWLGLQKIHYVLSKMEDEKNNGKNKFLRSKTTISRDFIDKNSGRRKKGPRWGCFSQTISRNGTTS
ncbi:hypothetical protein OROMI_026651 [Orobanche minor]